MTAAARAGLARCISAFAAAADTIKVGILRPLSGSMANSESTLKDTMLMLIAEQNKKGGLLGEIQDDGRFQVVWQTDKEVPGDVWSDYLPRSKDIIADWRPSISYGHYDVKTKKCSGKAY